MIQKSNLNEYFLKCGNYFKKYLVFLNLHTPGPETVQYSFLGSVKTRFELKLMDNFNLALIALVSIKIN